MGKPKRTSITVTVRNGDNFRATRPGKTWSGVKVKYEGAVSFFGINLSVKDFFPGTPAPPYKLTLRVLKNGRYKVTDDVPWADPVLALKDRNGEMFPNCTIPKDWVGLRVSRKVEAIR